MQKFRYAEMLPHEIVERRRKFPAALIGLGVLEWHGEHQAVGLDGLKPEKLCELAAIRSGGFAFPTLWYAEPRVHRLMEFSFDADGHIKSKMGFDRKKFTASYFRKTAGQQERFYQDLLRHILVQMNTLEMKAICLVCGHTPLRDLASPVVNQFNRSFRDTQAFAGDECDYAPEPPGDIGAETGESWYPAPTKASKGKDDTGKREFWYRKYVGVDHAGKWETSLLWYLRPDCVDMSVYLGRERERLVGIFGLDPRNTASVEVGHRASDRIADGIVRKAEELIERAK